MRVVPVSLLLVATLTAGEVAGTDDKPAPAGRPTAACAVVVTVLNPDQFYPPGSLRRAEEGEVVLEFTADPGADRPRDVQIVKSSGFAELDAAALKVAKAMQVSSPCSTQTVRRSLQFAQWRSEKDSTPWGTIEGTVQILPYEE
jgi:TonB family protein